MITKVDDRYLEKAKHHLYMNCQGFEYDKMFQYLMARIIQLEEQINGS